MRIALFLGLTAATLLVAGGVLMVRPIAAQAPTSVTIKNGIVVQEVRVGGSCVVIANYAGIDRPSNEVAMTPCRP
jgi:hypothetical protein